MIRDNHGRPINYLRLAVTDRCNLRCFYCMPEEGISFLPKPHLLTFEEMVRMVTLMAEMGITKVRITGGEPFVRKDMMAFLRSLKNITGIEQVNITTNGVLTAPLVPELKELGISSVNLSLDTLDRERFKEMTRRDELPNVLKTLDALLESGIKTKINAVVMAGKNDQDILPLVNLSKELPVSVRFIEEMPFNGSGINKEAFMSHTRIIEKIRDAHPSLKKLKDEAHSTSSNYSIDDYQGNVGVIAAFTRTFCGSCNRIRVTPTGTLKTCLYDDGVMNIRDILRMESNNEIVKGKLLIAFSNRPKDGFEAEALRSAEVSESMTTIGG
ncbi:GTP 3',8-cyclase MoaA [Jiulongibacter sediminis]|uniref:GTP 3',8-cyclase MoaA n=1 Tax=Jiulongibacter sediminis TaxID=1605367 RepID=UPI0026F24C73|nr:GTP 3',8-cyclase MoaA [Jiulongibacter sediminis]